MHNSNRSIVKMAHQSKINDMDKWNENGYLITCSNDKSIKIWNSKLDFLTSISSHNSHVTTCRCNQRADIIISGEENGTVNLWDVHDTKSSIWSQSFCIKSRNSISSVDFDSTGTLFCVSTHDGELSVWDIRSLDDSPKVIQKYDVKSSCARFQPKNPFILTIGSDNIPCIYDLRAKSLLYSFEGHKRVCCACGWSVDGEMFATADIDGVVLLWEMPKKKKKNPFETFEITSVEPYHPPEINLTPELLMSQLDLITKIANKLNEKLDEQEKRIAKLAESYPEIGGFEYYDC
ncbi:POC1 centriolar protein A isoform X2 [Histomonas meleagridis]|nr:POC1 centriolar protein A isoform X2 [Histomonas meleagridis]